MSDPRAEAADLYDRAAAELDLAAAELDLAARHARVAARRLRDGETPRAGAHAWAAHGHHLTAQDLLGRAAQLHATRSRPD